MKEMVACALAVSFPQDEEVIIAVLIDVGGTAGHLALEIRVCADEGYADVVERQLPREPLGTSREHASHVA